MPCSDSSLVRAKMEVVNLPLILLLCASPSLGGGVGSGCPLGPSSLAQISCTLRTLLNMKAGNSREPSLASSPYDHNCTWHLYHMTCGACPGSRIGLILSASA